MKPIKAIIHALLSLLLLVTTMGVTVHKHYCMGRIQDVAYFQEAHSCMEKAGISDTMECPKTCCQNTAETFKVDDLVNATFTFSSDFIITFLPVDAIAFNPHWVISSFQNNHHNYTPPLLTEYLPTRDQCFLLLNHN